MPRAYFYKLASDKLHNFSPNIKINLLIEDDNHSSVFLETPKTHTNYYYHDKKWTSCKIKSLLISK